MLIAFVVAGTLGRGRHERGADALVEALQQRVFARVALELGFKVPRRAVRAVAEQRTAGER